MQIVADRILRHKKLVLVIFLSAMITCALMIPGVSVNYNLADYLPEDAPSTIALNTMYAEFEQEVPNTRVYIPNVSLTEALALKEELSKIEGVSGVTWLDDVVNLQQPLELADQETVEAYYREGGALYSLTMASENSLETLHTLRELAGEDGAVAGESVLLANAQEMAGNEMSKIIFVLVPIVLVILLLTTRSWIEPLLFLAAIGVSILINMGTNLIFGEISFITQAVSPILQLAVSMDYAIFLLNSFTSERKQTCDVLEAMAQAMKKSFSAVLASALTTIFGFLALVLMRFKIGPDLGIVLAKGILLSLLSVMLLLPALAISCHKLIDKTAHRSFIPAFGRLGKAVRKVRVPVLIVVLLIALPCFFAQQSNHFIYGNSSVSEELRTGRDEAMIEEKFGRSVPMVMLVPAGQMGTETALIDELAGLPHVTSIISYASMVGAQIPAEMLPADTLAQLQSENYSRIILYVDTEDEGQEAFDVVEQVQKIAARYYGDEALLCGTSVNNYDMRDVVTDDTSIVNLLAILAIGVVLLFTFKSISLPLLLLLTIEASIWINLAIPYFTGTTICYIGYLVINTVQLGATVDYAILLTEHYVGHRKLFSKKDAAVKTIQDVGASILTSAAILTAAGFVIGAVSGEAVVSELGTLLGRGAAISAVMVLFFLPALLMLFDRVIEKTTLRMQFAPAPREKRAVQDKS